MAESPSRGGAPNAEDASDTSATKGESDPLFNPPGLKTRRTVMGLAPAPHLGGAKGGGTLLTEAEERKQRVLSRIATMDGKDVTGPPPPAEEGTRLVETDPPPRMSNAPPRPNPSMHPKFGTSTVLMQPSPVGPGGPRRISSDGRLPSASGWEVHDPSRPMPQREAPEVATEVIEPPPITARMPAQITAMQPQGQVRPSPSMPPAPMPVAALAVRTYEPSYVPRNALGHLTDPRLVILTEPNSSRSASYRLLRDNLLAKGMPRVLAISSATPGDGKTTCATNLALTLAEMSSTRVLLIDANFFEPELGNVFGIERFSPIVPPDGNVGWLEPYKLVEITPGLHVAGVVRRPGEPAPRFDQQRFEAMIDRLVRVSYDYILIDTPAMRATPAVIQLIATADATLMAVRSGGTAGRDLRRAVDQIPEKKAFGIALIDAPQVE